MAWRRVKFMVVMLSATDTLDNVSLAWDHESSGFL